MTTLTSRQKSKLKFTLFKFFWQILDKMETKVVAEYYDSWITLTQAYLFECPECGVSDTVIYDNRQYTEVDKICSECGHKFIVVPDEDLTPYP